MKRYIRTDITTPVGAPSLVYPDGWIENAGKIYVMAYDDEAHTCYAWLDDETLFTQLMASGKVTEITQEQMETEVARLRPEVEE